MRRGAHARLVPLLAHRRLGARHHAPVVRQAAGARLPRRPRLGQDPAAAAAARRGRVGHERPLRRGVRAHHRPVVRRLAGRRWLHEWLTGRGHARGGPGERAADRGRRPRHQAAGPAAAGPDWSDAHGQADYDVRFDWGPDGLDAVVAGAGGGDRRRAAVHDRGVGGGRARAPRCCPTRGAVATPRPPTPGDTGPSWPAGASRALVAVAHRPARPARGHAPGAAVAQRLGARLRSGRRGRRRDARDVTVMAGCLRNAAAVAARRRGPPGPGGGRGGRRALAGQPRARAARRRGPGRCRRGAAWCPRAPPGRRARGGVAVTRGRGRRGRVRGRRRRRRPGAWLAATASGRELVVRGHADDVAAAAVLDAEAVAPVLDGPRFVARDPAAPLSP